MSRKPTKLKTLNCLECGKSVEIKDTKRNKNRKFCSSKCAKTNNGKRNLGRKHSDEVNKKKGRSGEDNAFYGKKHTREFKQSLSERRSGKSWEKLHGKEKSTEMKKNLSKSVSGKNNPFYGKTHSEETKQFLKSHTLNRKNPNYYPGVREAHSKRMTGDGNPAWQGGASTLYSDYDGLFTEELKTSVRQRDKFTCQVCFNRGHVVHHIDYDKLNCSKNNLVTVCCSCHGKTNWNRDRWEMYFKELMNG